MYDELIKRLRNHAIRADSEYEIGNSMYLDILKAADAIEELSKPKWIPVTERLPDEDGRYLVSYPLFNIQAWMRVAYFSTDLHRTDSYAFPGKWNKRPGFYYSDDEYGDVELKDITHWMPLPQPPKEEK